jgi:acid phosphatase (class A)
MKTGLIAGGVALSAALVAAFAVAQAPSPPAGYLSAASVPDATKILPPPPAAGSGRDADDRSIFVATRPVLSTPRGVLATSDANLIGEPMYACAMGAVLDPAKTPALNNLMRKVMIDTGKIINAPKDHYNRKRPYLVVPVAGSPAAGPPICVPKSKGLADNGSYPSGHSTLSWTWGLILADLEPDRSTEIMSRARSIGESRIVCGVHYASDVEAGRVTGSLLFAALESDAGFRADLEKARAEVAAARKAGSAPASCAAQNDAAAHPPY